MSKPGNFVPLGDVVEKIVGGGTPSRKIEEYYEGNIPWVTVKDLIHYKLSDSQEHITEEAIKNSSANIISKGNVIVATRMGLGKAFINLVEVAINQDLKALIPNKDRITSEYLLYCYLGMANKIVEMGTGTTVKGIRLEQLRALPIYCPSIVNQQYITSILISVDEVIEKTKAIIEKSENVKKGLMQNLFTKGIGHTKFKKTEIGKIPEEWEVKKLEDICSKIFVGIATSTTNSYTDNGVPIIRNQNIHEDKLVTKDLLQITIEFSEKNKTKKLEQGDIITVRTGYPGTSCVVPKFLVGAHTFTTLVSRPNNQIIDSYFLSRYINSDYGKKFVVGGKAGGAQQNLNVSILKKLPVPIPGLAEQLKIVKLIQSVDNKVDNEKNKLQNLQNLKTGLMQVLLTGKVRLKVDEEEVITS